AKRLCDNSVGKAANKLSDREVGFAMASVACFTARDRTIQLSKKGACECARRLAKRLRRCLRKAVPPAGNSKRLVKGCRAGEVPLDDTAIRWCVVRGLMPTQGKRRSGSLKSTRILAGNGWIRSASRCR